MIYCKLICNITHFRSAEIMHLGFAILNTDDWTAETRRSISLIIHGLKRD